MGVLLGGMGGKAGSLPASSGQEALCLVLSLGTGFGLPSSGPPSASLTVRALGLSRCSRGVLPSSPESPLPSSEPDLSEERAALSRGVGLGLSLGTGRTSLLSFGTGLSLSGGTGTGLSLWGGLGHRAAPLPCCCAATSSAATAWLGRGLGEPCVSGC